MIQNTDNQKIDLEKEVIRQNKIIRDMQRKIDKLQTQQKSTKKDKAPIPQD